MTHIKYRFLAPDFDAIVDGYEFKEVKRESFDEEYFDLEDSSLMKGNIWLKKVVSCSSDGLISLKHHEPLEGSPFYNVQKWRLKDAACLERLESQLTMKYCFHVHRVTYRLPNSGVKLTKETVFIPNISKTFTMQTISGNVPRKKTGSLHPSSLMTKTKPLRSKITELLLACDRELFFKLK